MAKKVVKKGTAKQGKKGKKAFKQSFKPGAFDKAKKKVFGM